MKDTRVQRFLFVTCVCALSIPWLTPCGATLIPGAMLMMADQGVRRLKGDPTLGSPSQWRSIAGKPALRCVVRGNQSIPRSLLISAHEWTNGPRAQNSRVEAIGTSSIEKMADLLVRIDPGHRMPQNGRQQPEQHDEPVKRMVISLTPLVVLEADRLRFTRSNSRELPALAEASTDTMMSKATIHTAEGNLFASALRICYRATTRELILDGNAIVLSGRRQIKPSKPGALIRIRFTANPVVVDVQGPAVESQF